MTLQEAFNKYLRDDSHDTMISLLETNGNKMIVRSLKNHTGRGFTGHDEIYELVNDKLIFRGRK